MTNRISHLSVLRDAEPTAAEIEAARAKAIETMRSGIEQLHTTSADVGTEIGRTAGILSLLHHSLDKKSKPR